MPFWSANFFSRRVRDSHAFAFFWIFAFFCSRTFDWFFASRSARAVLLFIIVPEFEILFSWLFSSFWKFCVLRFPDHALSTRESSGLRCLFRLPEWILFGRVIPLLSRNVSRADPVSVDRVSISVLERICNSRGREVSSVVEAKVLFIRIKLEPTIIHQTRIVFFINVYK